MAAPREPAPAFTAEAKLACARRELAQRERVYPRLIAQGKMTPNFAAREQMLMRAIAADYAALAAQGRLL